MLMSQVSFFDTTIMDTRVSIELSPSTIAVMQVPLGSSSRSRLLPGLTVYLLVASNL